MTTTAYRVVIAAHAVPPRWKIPAYSGVHHATTAQVARLMAVRHVHIVAGVPALKSLLRVSWRHSQAVPEPTTPEPIGGTYDH